MIVDQVVDADTARQLHAEAVSTRAMAAWIVMTGQIDYPGKLVARLATTAPTVYVLLADTLAGLRDALPRGLDYSERQPADPDGVLEVWFSPN